MTMHNGHRSRLRERFRSQGLDSFAPHEILELLLCYSRPRGDVNPLAHELITHFGSLQGVFEAGVDQLLLVKGVGLETATLLSMILPLFRAYQRSLISDTCILSNKNAVVQYCTSLFTGIRTERFYLICLSASYSLLGYRLIAEGSLSEVPAYPRVIAEAAMSYNAHTVIFCHNHPRGLALPSDADLHTTHALAKTLNDLGIRLLDHIIVADRSTYSMVEHNDLAFHLPRKG